MEETKDYENFAAYIKKLLLIILDQEEDEIYFEWAAKENKCREDQLVVCKKTKDGIWKQDISIKQAYLEYKKGREPEAIAADMAWKVKKAEPIRKTTIFRELCHYERVQKRLVIRAINYKRNKEDLKQFLHREIGDIALVLYYVAAQEKGELMTCKVNRDRIKQWELPEEAIFINALNNTKKQYPPRIYSFWELFQEEGTQTLGTFLDEEAPVRLNHSAMGNCLTNSIKINGAVSIFLPGVANRIGHLLEGDFYIAFTSIHESMIHKAANTDPEKLAEALERMGEDEDFLSRHVYCFHRHNAAFRMVL